MIESRKQRIERFLSTFLVHTTDKRDRITISDLKAAVARAQLNDISYRSISYKEVREYFDEFTTFRVVSSRHDGKISRCLSSVAEGIKLI